MTDKLEKAIRDGNRAAILLDDPVLKEALDKLEQLEIEALLSCAPDEVIEYRAHVVAVRRFRNTLRAYVDNAIIAKATVQQ